MPGGGKSKGGFGREISNWALRLLVLRRRFRFRWQRLQQTMMTKITAMATTATMTSSFTSVTLMPARRQSARQRASGKERTSMIKYDISRNGHLQSASSESSYLPQLCMPLHLSCGETQKLLVVHLNNGRSHLADGSDESFISVQVA